MRGGIRHRAHASARSREPAPVLTFAAAVFFLIITPGPGVLSTAGVGSGYGFRAGLKYVLGLFIGTNLVALAVISGVAAVVLAQPVIRWVLMGASIAYLLYLAARIAFAGSRIAFIEAERAPGAGAGILLQAINPKAYAVNTTLFAGFPFAPDALLFETIAKLVIVNLIWIPIHLGWLYAGVTLHRLNLSPAAHRRINVAMALSMLAVVALAILAGLRQA
jgi:threonine/homoserine/homoserine lactone efflux protein